MRYISHGDLPDGGFRHEKFYALTLTELLEGEYIERRKRRLFIGLANLYLFVWGFFESTGTHNVVAARLGISSWLRNLWTKGETFIVVHDYDKNRYNSFLLKMYYPLLFWLLATIKPKRVKMVVISPHWVNYFHQRKKIPKENLILFYNFLDVKHIVSKRSQKKERQIHLGQYSIKNSHDVFIIAEKLTELGYACYFSTLDEFEVSEEKTFSVKYFNSYDDYLNCMAKSCYTLGFSKFHEGWNRVVHESALLNTPVIAYRMGGMKDLVKESNGYLVDSIEEALDVIRRDESYSCPSEFEMRYDTSRALNCLKEQYG